MHVLVFNAGSASLKFEVIDLARDSSSASQGKKQISGILEGIGGDSVLSLLKGKDTDHKEPLPARDYGDAAAHVLDYLKNKRGIAPEQIDLVAHRVVHGADRFSEPTLVDDAVLKQIEALEDLAPLHNSPAVSVIRSAREVLGPEKPMVAGFDTVFHQTIPPAAYTYALPSDVAARHGIRRYGFHGLSHRYLRDRYAEITKTPLEKVNIITLHLESGASACAIQGGKSIETSMGFTPLEGLVMGTRSGDLDPALIGFLARKEQLSIEQVEEILNKKSGLKGLSGLSHDTRDLEKEVDRNPQVRLALEVFCHRVVKYIGAYLAAVGAAGHEGAAAIVFGGGIGEDSPRIRQQICSAFQWCGLHLDSKANESTINRESRISTEGSRLHAWVIPTEEGLSLAYQAVRYFAGQPAL